MKKNINKIPKVAIIVCSYNQQKLLDECLVSIKNNTSYKNYKVYFVDDSGIGKIGNYVKKKFKWVDVTINKENKGFSGANNIGIKKALSIYSPDYVLLLNDDTQIIDKNWIRKMVSVGENNHKTGILGCRLLYPDKSLQWFAKNGKITYLTKKGYFNITKEISKNQKVNDIIGACFLIKKSVIDKIGFLDEEFNPIYGEETDYCFRATKKGFNLVYVGNTEIIHHGGSSSKEIFNEKVWFIKKRNSIRLEWLNYDVIKIIRYTTIHLGSAILSKNPLKKLNLLLNAYKHNIKRFKDIKQKRKERRN